MFFCRKGCLDGLFVLPLSSFHSPGDFVTDDQPDHSRECRPELRAGGRERFWLPETPDGWQLSGSPTRQGVSQVEWSAREVCDQRPATICPPFSHQLGTSFHTPQWKVELFISEAFLPDPAPWISNLAVAYSYFNFDCYMSLSPHNLWESML